MTKKWGPATWYLIHTVCEKVDEEFYAKNRKQIITLLKGLCSNLPCGECSKHAQQEVKNLTYKNAPTKALLKSFFFQFHNNVNKRLRKPTFSNYDMYKLTTLRKVFSYYNSQIKLSIIRTNGFSNTMYMMKMNKALAKYIQDNWEGFNWN